MQQSTILTAFLHTHISQQCVWYRIHMFLWLGMIICRHVSQHHVHDESI